MHEKIYIFKRILYRMRDLFDEQKKRPPWKMEGLKNRADNILGNEYPKSYFIRKTKFDNYASLIYNKSIKIK